MIKHLVCFITKILQNVDKHLYCCYNITEIYMKKCTRNNKTITDIFGVYSIYEMA